jgi:DNA-directed RNA polymerase subunit RPC12/RpoP
MGLLKISEVTYNHRGYFHDSCYQKVSRQIVEKKKTINCPVCQQPNLFSYGQNNYSGSRLHNYHSISCANCGHPYAYTPREENDPYCNCMYCGFLLEKSLEVQIIGSQYAHKVCNTNERQYRELQRKKNQENMVKMREQERKTREEDEKKAEEKIREEKKKKNLSKKFKSAIDVAYVPLLIPGGFFLVFGNFWGSLVCGVLLAIFIIWYIHNTPDDPWL